MFGVQAGGGLDFGECRFVLSGGSRGLKEQRVQQQHRLTPMKDSGVWLHPMQQPAAKSQQARRDTDAWTERSETPEVLQGPRLLGTAAAKRASGQ